MENNKKTNRAFVDMAGGGGNKWPPDDLWGYPYGDRSEDKSDWKETYGKKWKCPKDSHKPADTGMRVSYCKKCEVKLVFTNWEWEEVYE